MSELDYHLRANSQEGGGGVMAQSWLPPIETNNHYSADWTGHVTSCHGAINIQLSLNDDGWYKRNKTPHIQMEGMASAQPAIKSTG